MVPRHNLGWSLPITIGQLLSSKLTGTQQKYSVTEIDSAIVETLKEYKGMLWGQKITVYTYHENHTRDA
ncbi:LOW QUALITY PROTEIN: hypothetical protein ACHAW6_009626 [Cyclotella cf. meneghiniana]